MNGRAVSDRQARSPECLARLDIGAALRNVQLDVVRYSGAPSEAMLLCDWLAGSVICTLPAVDRASFVVWS